MAASSVEVLVAELRTRSDVHAQKMESARARLRKAEEESAWRDYERARKFEGLRAEQDGARAVRSARFVSAVEG